MKKERKKRLNKIASIILRKIKNLFLPDVLQNKPPKNAANQEAATAEPGWRLRLKTAGSWVGVFKGRVRSSGSAYHGRVEHRVGVLESIPKCQNFRLEHQGR